MLISKLKYFFTSAALFLLPAVTFAALTPEQAQRQAALEAASFVDTLNRVIIFPTIALLTAVAFLVFLWGCFEYFANAANDQARQQGVKHITYGIIGLVVMVSAWAILNLFVNSVGLDDEIRCADDPNAVNCTGVFSL